MEAGVDVRLLVSLSAGSSEEGIATDSPLRENKPAPRQKEGREERGGGQKGDTDESDEANNTAKAKRTKTHQSGFQTRPVMLFGRETVCKTTQSGVVGEEGLVETSRVGLVWRFGRDVECELRRVLEGELGTDRRRGKARTRPVDLTS